jgi:hypothetical protein
MKCFKNNNKIRVIVSIFMVTVMTHASTAFRRLVTSARPVLQNTAQDLRVNWREHAKSAGGWGLGSLGYYAAVDYLKDVNPSAESKHIVSYSDVKDSGIPEDTPIHYFEKSSFDNRGNIDKGWARNGKGFWGNLSSVLAPSTPYFNKKRELMIPTDMAEKVASGDKEAVGLVNEKIKSEFERYMVHADVKEDIACAANIALLRGLFGALPYAKTAKSLTESAEWIASAVGNRFGIRGKVGTMGRR